MIVYKIPVGPLQTNCYLVADKATKETFIIDPGDNADKVLDIIKKNNLKPKAIILTHTHFDHNGAVEDLVAQKIPMAGSLQEGEQIKIGDMTGIGLKTPGHSSDSICFVFEKEGLIFSGDTLFKQGIGRTDLDGGDYSQIQKSLKRLMKYPDHFKVYPGHGLETTIGDERHDNPFVDTGPPLGN